MQNGSQSQDLILKILNRQSDKTDWIIHSLGRTEEQLRAGHRLHEQLIDQQQRHGQAIDRLGRTQASLRQDLRKVQKRSTAPCTMPDSLKATRELVDEYWQYLMLAGVVAGKVAHWLLDHLAFFASN